MGGPAGLTDSRPTIVLADDHIATRCGARIVLEANGFRVVAEVGSADEAVAAAIEHTPRICLVADHLPGGDLAAVRGIASALPATKIAVFTASESPSDLLRAVLAGADGYVPKAMNPERLPATLRALLDEEAVVPRALTAGLITELRRRNGPRNIALAAGAAALTDREFEVLALLREGMTTAAMADRLRISPVTVRRHVSASVQKLGERDRSGAVRLLAGGGGEG
ncbi:MAG: response regulator [Solirubrobacteraceae bacterium]